jgi:hypothetical protein
VKRPSAKRQGEFALIWICILMSLVVAAAVVRRASADWGLYAMLAVTLGTLLAFTRRK